MQYVYCDYPDDGSAHKCLRKPTTVHKLLTIKRDGRSYSACFECWAYKESSESQVRKQFDAVGGYNEATDPPLFEKNYSKNLFTLLCNRVHAEEASRIVKDPNSSIKTLEAVC